MERLLHATPRLVRKARGRVFKLVHTDVYRARFLHPRRRKFGGPGACVAHAARPRAQKTLHAGQALRAGHQKIARQHASSMSYKSASDTDTQERSASAFLRAIAMPCGQAFKGVPEVDCCRTFNRTERRPSRLAYCAIDKRDTQNSR